MESPTKYLSIIRQWKFNWKRSPKKIMRHGGQSTRKLINFISKKLHFFLKDFLEKFKKNPNVPQNIPSEI